MATFPSFHKIVEETKQTLLRFPLEILVAIVATLCAIYAYDEKDKEIQRIFIKIIMSCSLCLVLFLSISLHFLRDQKNNIFRFGSSLILGALLFVFVFQFSNPFKPLEIYQFFSLNLALHLLVSFAAFIQKQYDENAFWEFNKQLFLRILTAGLYSSVIYAGLSFALLATHNLFNIDFYDTIYLDLFYLVYGIFNTVFFLAGIPETNNSKVPLKLQYPVGLKKFTQFVLIPLISIYLVILLSYEVKIIASFELPVGWVSNLILVFAIFGILSLLLIHPIANDHENVWMRTFHKWFYFLLVPLLGLLFWAILYRINLYGVTHERYYVLALAVWLTVLTFYFICIKNSKIIFIPVSMCVIAFVTLFGPQSADSISKKSQLNRFEKFILKSKTTKLTEKEEKDLSSIVLFINDNYGISPLAPYSKKIAIAAKKDKTMGAAAIMKELGFTYRGSQYRGENNGEAVYYYYNSEKSLPIDNIQGYALAFELNRYATTNCDDCITIDSKGYSISHKMVAKGIELTINNEKILLPINDFVFKNKELIKQNTEQLIQNIRTKNFDFRLNYKSVNGQIEEDQVVIENYDITIYVKIK
ncbi:DUF4153 domain-containing protein [Flavobacterium faecale]|uniref:DUF4153 domain-containing protein n=1 Tax=Flavobacterium faecale TaxID=1355330 RepID=A0A2S1LC21_9FLAO|nr:DUF4153 domain-containing protein [Flavobacterium faecale]AWG21248.1 DUF4153 domain-containing protein [Flavobacterium faecale]